MSKTQRVLFAAIVPLILTIAVQSSDATGTAAAPSCHAITGAQRGALVELYTSEGCSSCPPADKWFAAVAQAADPGRVSALAFHVDYWDSIGWSDRFGSSAFSERQHQRVTSVGSSAVYTPQVMLGERVGFPWGSPAGLDALRAVNAQPSPLALDLAAVASANGLDVSLKAAPSAAGVLPIGMLYLALYENGLSTQVKAGENSGVLLHHDRVVRQLLGPFALSGAQWSRVVHVVRPHDARADHLGLTAFVQSAKGDTLQALSLPLASCAR